MAGSFSSFNHAINSRAASGDPITCYKDTVCSVAAPLYDPELTAMLDALTMLPPAQLWC